MAFVHLFLLGSIFSTEDACDHRQVSYSSSCCGETYQETCSTLRSQHLKEGCCPNSRFDYIIVGGGAAGCTVAVTLAETHPNKKVLVLERGLPRNREENMEYNMTYNPDDPKYFTGSTAFNSVDVISDDDIPVHDSHPKVLGGGSTINHNLFHDRPSEYLERYFPSIDREQVASDAEWLVERMQLSNTWQSGRNMSNPFYSEFEDALSKPFHPFSTFSSMSTESKSVLTTTYEEVVYINDPKVSKVLGFQTV